MMYVEFMKNCLLPNSSELMAVRFILASSGKKRLISFFLDMMFVGFKNYFLLADSSAVIAVRLISVC